MSIAEQANAQCKENLFADLSRNNSSPFLFTPHSLVYIIFVSGTVSFKDILEMKYTVILQSLVKYMVRANLQNTLDGKCLLCV